MEGCGERNSYHTLGGGFMWSGSRSFYADNIKREAGIKNKEYIPL